ncbi:MAG TPA: hypothetical protein VGW35_06105 [Methylomirabilota bacterium]|nr:hypothetical protein [Methylomirabilota bacterium]
MIDLSTSYLGLTLRNFKRGIELLRVVRANLSAWMEAHGYESIRQMQGSMSYRSVAEPAEFERANYLKVLSSYVLRSEERLRTSTTTSSRPA